LAGGVAERVVEEVAENLLDPIRVDGNRRCTELDGRGEVHPGSPKTLPVGRHGRVDKVRDGHWLGVEKELALLRSRDDLQVANQSAEAATLLLQRGEGLVVDGEYAFPYGFDRRADGRNRCAHLVRELTGQLTPGLLGGLQPVGELVHRGGQGGELRTHPGIDEPGLQMPIGKSSGDVGRVGHGSREPCGDQPADGDGGHPGDDDSYAERDQDRLVERADNMLLEKLVRHRLKALEMGIEDGRPDEKRRDQDRARSGQDHQQVVEHQAGDQSQSRHPRRATRVRHPDPIR
jgi:hypothetical protein